MKSYTDLEQSKRLEEILPIESADMYYFLDPTPAGNIYHLTVQRVDVGIKNLPHYDEGDIPCWSLAALMDVLDRGALFITPQRWACQSYINFKAITSDYYDNPIDACVALIEKLYEQKLL